MYKNLKDKKYFMNVKVRGWTVEWKNGEDVWHKNLYYDSIEYSKFLEKNYN